MVHWRASVNRLLKNGNSITGADAKPKNISLRLDDVNNYYSMDMILKFRKVTKILIMYLIWLVTWGYGFIENNKLSAQSVLLIQIY